jgi:hypothetical protein
VSLHDQIIDDLDIFFDGGDFEIEVTYKPYNAQAKQIRIHSFNDEADRGTTQFKEVIMRLSDVPNLSKRDTFEYDGDTFKVLSTSIDSQRATARALLQRSTV